MLNSVHQKIYTVSQLNQEVGLLLEGSFPLLWVEGKISNLIKHSSGHWYFSLKDQQTQVRCAMFRSRNYQIKFPVKEGIHVVLKASAGFYQQRGEFQSSGKNAMF